MGFFVILSLLVGVVVDAPAVYLRRQGFNSLADGAALAAADASRPSRCTTEDSMGTARWTPESRAGTPSSTSTRPAPTRYPGLGLAVFVDGDSVIVKLAAPLDLPIGRPGWDKRPVVAGSAAAFVVVENYSARSARDDADPEAISWSQRLASVR